MRVGILHNAYRFRGGEESVVEAEAAVLRDAGVYVDVLTIDNREQYATLRGKLRGTFSEGLGWNERAGKAIQNWVREHRFDVVHVHNLYPFITGAGPSAIAALRLPVVATLHNFRGLCARGDFTRDGNRCTACVDKGRSQAVINGCYRGSRMQSASWFLTQQRAQANGVWDRDIVRYIAPSQHVRDTYVAAGFDADAMTVRPHFTTITPVRREEREGVVVVGRVEDAKGIPELVRRWPEHAPRLTVIGTGDRESELRSLNKPNVAFTGQLGRDEIADRFGSACLNISASQLPETFGLTLIEAAACATPTVAFATGAAPSIIRDRVTGRLVEPGDFDSLIASAFDLCIGRAHLRTTMSDMARRTYERQYAPEAGLRSLLDVYHDAMSCKKEAA